MKACEVTRQATLPLPHVLLEPELTESLMRPGGSLLEAFLGEEK